MNVMQLMIALRHTLTKLLTYEHFDRHGWYA
jgi:hypothetical protein